MSHVSTITNIEDFISTHLNEAHENYIKLAKNIHSLLSDLKDHGFSIFMVGDHGGIKHFKHCDKFKALEHIFSADYAIAIMRNSHGDKLVCHFDQARLNPLVNYSVVSACSNRQNQHENLLLKLVEKAENMHQDQ